MPEAFAEELQEAFTRMEPQGSAEWNFSVAFTQLKELIDEVERDISQGDGSASPWHVADDAIGGDRRSPGDSPERRLHERAIRRAADPLLGRLQPFIEARVSAAAAEATRSWLTEGLGGVDRELAQVLEALRFLSARVDTLARVVSRTAQPVDGLAWLVEPESLAVWAPTLVELFDHAGGPLLHGECGSGELLAALGAQGVSGEGCEPRGGLALQAAERGLTVHVAGVAAHLAAVAPRSLGGLVLSGVVDRVALADQLDLLDAGTERLQKGAPLAVIGTHPSAIADRWSAVAQDLVPGRPMHPETWTLLLERAGYSGLEAFPSIPGSSKASGTYVVTGRRP